ncbi:hypothetical protein BH18VER1_BH18VER1_01630 [soil metagenome]
MHLPTALEQMKTAESLGAYKPSTAIDHEMGRPFEVEAIWGEPLRRATAAGAPMPRLQRLYEELPALNLSGNEHGDFSGRHAGFDPQQ